VLAFSFAVSKKVILSLYVAIGAQLLGFVDLAHPFDTAALPFLAFSSIDANYRQFEDSWSLILLILILFFMDGVSW
jgi:hypothetical protein